MRPENERIINNARAMVSKLNTGVNRSLANTLFDKLKKAVEMDEYLYPMRKKLYPSAYRENLDKLSNYFKRLQSVFNQQEDKRQSERILAMYRGHRMLVEGHVETCSFTPKTSK